MGIQRVVDLVSILVVTALIVRSLSRDEYGMLSIVMSYGLIFSMLNVSVSSVLLRDYQKFKVQIGEYMQAYLLFSLIKGSILLLLSVLIGYFLYRHYHDYAMIMVLALSVASTIILGLTEPFSVLLSVDFRQPVLTKIYLISSLANIFISAGAILVPTAIFVAAKNVFIALIVLVLTAGYTGKHFHLWDVLPRGNRLRLIKESFVGFSLWSHLMGIMTDIVYRADFLILGWLGAPFRTVGNYNISLQMANFTKLLPQIIQYNASLGLSQSDGTRRREEMTFLFVKYSFLLSLATMVGYVLFGRLAIQVIAGSDVEEIYGFGFYIVGGLCLFNTFRPLISYGSVVHNIRECFFYAIVPSSMSTLVCYVVMGSFGGAKGLAMANLFGGMAMMIFTLLYIHMRTGFRWRFSPMTGTEKALFAKIFAEWRGDTRAKRAEP